MKRLLFISLLFLISCTPLTHNIHFEYTNRTPVNNTTKHISILIDGDFGEEDKISIDNAIGSWNYVLNGNIKLDVIDYGFDKINLKSDKYKNSILILKVDSYSYKLPKDKLDRKVIAITNHNGGNIIYLVRDNISNNEKVEMAIRHEIGHVMGAKHIYGKNSLMNDNLNYIYSQCIDIETMKEVVKIQGLNIDKVNYCEFED